MALFEMFRGQPQFVLKKVAADRIRRLPSRIYRTLIQSCDVKAMHFTVLFSILIATLRAARTMLNTEQANVLFLQSERFCYFGFA